MGWAREHIDLRHRQWLCKGKARQDKARHGKARHGKARHGKARQGKARQGKARQGKARQGKADLLFHDGDKGGVRNLV